MLRGVNDLLGGAKLHHLAVTQHHDVIRHLRHHREVVGDVKRCHTGVANRLFDRRQHAHLGGDVERRGGLVKHNQVGLRAQSHGRHGALQLSTRHLVRKTLPKILRVGQAQLFKEGQRPLLRLRAVAHAVVQRSLHHLRQDTMRRVESRRRRLRHIGHLLAAQST